MRKVISVSIILLLVLLVFAVGCKEQAGEATRLTAARQARTSAPIAAPQVLPTMPVDSTPPGPVTNLAYSVGTNAERTSPNYNKKYIRLTWTNPTDSDFDYVKIKVGSEILATASGGSYDIYKVGNRDIQSTRYLLDFSTHDRSGNSNTLGQTLTVVVS